ncbi:MAG: hypothetical protein R3E39_31890 [Anaerolineae bacterium]
MAKLPLHWQAGRSRDAAELTELAGGNTGDRRCTGTCAAVGSLMAAALSSSSSSCRSTACRVLRKGKRQREVDGSWLIAGRQSLSTQW